MNTLVLLPNFVRFFQEAKNHAASAGHLAIIFLAFGKVFYLFVMYHHFHVSNGFCSLMQF